MYNLIEIKDIIINCKNDNEFLTVLGVIHLYKKHFSILDLKIINLIARRKINTIKHF